MNKKGQKNGSDSTEPKVTSLEEAKAAYEAAKKRVQEVKTRIRKDENLIKSAPKKVEQLKDRIAKAKARTTMSADELVKKADALLREAKELESKSAKTRSEAGRVSEEINDLQDELREVRVSQGLTPNMPGASPYRKKVGLLKALKRRSFVPQFDSKGIATGAVLDNLGIIIKFSDEGFTMTAGKEEMINMTFAGGMVHLIDKAVKKREAQMELEKSSAAKAVNK